MKHLVTKLLRLTQLDLIFWPIASSMALGWLVSANQSLFLRICNSFGILCLVMAIFAFGSIEDAPLDALSEGKNPNNPLSKGYLSIPDASKLSLVLAGIGLLLSAVSSRSTLLTNLAMLITGLFYFHHSLRLRQSLLLDALGFSILTAFLPFLSATILKSAHFGNNALFSGSLAFLLTFAAYFSRVETQAGVKAEENLRPRLSVTLALTSILVLLASFFVFTFSGLVPAWASALMLVLLLIMFNPQFSHHSSHNGTYTHAIFSIYQRALAIALVTFLLATQIFNIIR